MVLMGMRMQATDSLVAFRVFVKLSWVTGPMRVWQC